MYYIRLVLCIEYITLASIYIHIYIHARRKHSAVTPQHPTRIASPSLNARCLPARARWHRLLRLLLLLLRRRPRAAARTRPPPAAAETPPAPPPTMAARRRLRSAGAGRCRTMGAAGVGVGAERGAADHLHLDPHLDPHLNPHLYPHLYPHPAAAGDSRSWQR